MIPWLEGFEAVTKDPGLDTPALKQAMARARQLAAAKRPPLTGDAATLEARDVELAAARHAMAASPTADNHRRVAEAYVRLGVLDAAFDQFTAAIDTAHRDALAYDGRARVWREWGLASPALVDTYRAIFYAPKSPVPRNTLGTILLKMGQPVHARAAFELAVSLDPSASYAVNNLCYLSKMEGRACQATRP